MKKIVVIGSLNMDFLINVQRQPVIGETVLGESLSLNPGGKGANQAYAAAILGGDVTMLGAVGDDEFGQKLIDNLDRAGVTTKYLNIVPGVSTGAAFVSVNGDGDNSIIVIQGANKYVDRDYIDSAAEVIRESDIVILQLEIPLDTVIYAAKLARAMDKFLILDPAPVQELPDEFIKTLDIIKPNMNELMEIIGKRGEPCEPERDVKELRAKGVKHAIVTLGEGGCCLADDKGSVLRLPAQKAETVDTTGAGDCFTAAMAYGISNNMELTDALEFAGKVAAISVTRKGAQSSFPDLKEVKNIWGY